MIAKTKPNKDPDKSLADYARQLATQGKFAEALHTLEDSGNLDKNWEGLYVAAVCLRKLNESNKALQALQRVHALHPEYARAYQEIGHIHRAAGANKKAIAGYEAAVAKNPALIASWRALTELCLQEGLPQLHQHALLQLQQLQELPPELQAVKSHLYEGNTELADQICRHFLQQHKQHVEGMRLLAEIATQNKIIDDAEFILESAVSFEPDHIGARVDYAAILLKRQKFEKAHEVAARLCQEHPDDLQFKSLLGATELGLGNTDEALQIFKQLSAKKYNLQLTLLSLGHAHKTAGDLDQAVQAYQELYQFKPDYGDAFWSLANTKTYRFSDAEISHMEKFASDSATSREDQVHFYFALGKASEDIKEYDLAFKHYESGNRLHKKLITYESPAIEKRVARQKQVCTKALFAAKSGVGHPAPDPIFVVGLPRAGSTLLEQILASHSQIDGTLELPNILSLSRRLRGRAPSQADEEPQYPRILGELDDDYFRRFGEQYIEDTRVFRKNAPLFIDKMPNNFVHIGLIKLILPQAKIIDARRHPMSCCFSGFKQLFAEGQEFSYGLEDIGHYYKSYVDMMDHWDEVLPGFVLRIQHEDVVSDLETQVRRMLEFCDLPFEESCVEFYKTKRNVRTPSSEQVRQPIYTSALEHWRHFESNLEPLKQALGPDILRRYPIS